MSARSSSAAAPSSWSSPLLTTWCATFDMVSSPSPIWPDSEAFGQLGRPSSGDDVADRKRVLADMEQFGYVVGRRLAERYVSLNHIRLPDCVLMVGCFGASLVLRRRELLASSLDVVKFVCREFWRAVHGKPVDRLQREKASNVYVVEDFNYRLFANLAAPTGTDARDFAAKYACWIKGASRGCLAALGVACEVTFDIARLPALVLRFHVEAEAPAGADE